MKKSENVYNLCVNFKEFKEKAEKKGFRFEKRFYRDQDIGNYDIIKLIPPPEAIVIGRISYNQFLIMNSLSPSQKKDKERKRAFRQLEKLAKEFVLK